MTIKPSFLESLSVTGQNPTRPVPIPPFMSMKEVYEHGRDTAPFDYWTEPDEKHSETSPETSKIFPGISGAPIQATLSVESLSSTGNLGRLIAASIPVDDLSAVSVAMGMLKGNKKVLLGIAGEACSGKTTLCNHLVKEYGAVKTSFAEPLKQMLKTLGLTDAQLWGNEKHIPDHEILQGKTPRHAMQTLGTEWGRMLIDPNIWANAWLKMMEADQPTFTVIEDVRFDNEVAAIRKLGGKVIGLTRGIERRKKSRSFWDFGKRKSVHPSEDFSSLASRNGLRIIRNDGTVEDLAKQVLEEVR